jgi:hypothetical protein
VKKNRILSDVSSNASSSHLGNVKLENSSTFSISSHQNNKSAVIPVIPVTDNTTHSYSNPLSMPSINVDGIMRTDGYPTAVPSMILNATVYRHYDPKGPIVMSNAHPPACLPMSTTTAPTTITINPSSEMFANATVTTSDLVATEAMPSNVETRLSIKARAASVKSKDIVETVSIQLPPGYMAIISDLAKVNISPCEVIVEDMDDGLITEIKQITDRCESFALESDLEKNQVQYMVVDRLSTLLNNGQEYKNWFALYIVRGKVALGTLHQNLYDLILELIPTLKQMVMVVVMVKIL